MVICLSDFIWTASYKKSMSEINGQSLVVVHKSTACFLSLAIKLIIGSHLWRVEFSCKFFRNLFSTFIAQLQCHFWRQTRLDKTQMHTGKAGRGEYKTGPLHEFFFRKLQDKNTIKPQNSGLLIVFHNTMDPLPRIFLISTRVNLWDKTSKMTITTKRSDKKPNKVSFCLTSKDETSQDEMLRDETSQDEMLNMKCRKMKCRKMKCNKINCQKWYWYSKAYWTANSSQSWDYI